MSHVYSMHIINRNALETSIAYTAVLMESFIESPSWFLMNVPSLFRSVKDIRKEHLLCTSSPALYKAAARCYLHAYAGVWHVAYTRQCKKYICGRLK